MKALLLATALIFFPTHAAGRDLLLETMMQAWVNPEPLPPQEDESEIAQMDYEAEVYHWELGSPDNLPEIEIIYTNDNPCNL